MVERSRAASALAGTAALVLLTSCADGGADDGDFPSEDVTLIVPYDAGANVDTQARALTPCLEESWDNSVLVENRPGSSGTIGTTEVAHSEPDGHTLSLNSVSPYVLGPRLIEESGYSSEDLRSFGHATEAPILFFVAGDSEFDSMDDVVESAQENTMAASTPGTDSLQGLLISQLNSLYDTQFNHVPIDSTNDIVRGVSEGDYDVGVTVTSQDIIPRINEEEIKLLARGGDEEYEYFDDIPTYDDEGYGDLLPTTEISIPLIGPEGISDEVGEEIESTLEECVQDPEVIDALGEELVPAEFTGGSGSMEEYEELGEAIDQMQ